VSIISVPDNNGKVDLNALAIRLGSMQYNEILVEAGPTLSGALIREGWVDRVLLYQAPKFLGAFARPIGAFEVEQLSAAPGFVFQDVTRIGEDLRIIATRARSGSE